MHPSGRLEGCPCNLGEECTHTQTRLDAGSPDVPYQMDYLFASRVLAERLVTCVALGKEEWPSPSDHYPIVALFEG
jgi:endonuclease/exonuclease/phosphatase family metal-dependent hydrolase